MLDRAPQYDRFLRLPEVIRITGVAKTQVYGLIAAGGFPKPCKRGRASLWPESAVQDWITRQKAVAQAA